MCEHIEKDDEIYKEQYKMKELNLATSISLSIYRKKILIHCTISLINFITVKSIKISIRKQTESSMAENIYASSKSEVNYCGPVQELVNEVPDAYIWKDAYGFGPIDLTVPFTTEIPVIDFSQLISMSASTMDAELEKLRSALSSWGCFQLINHGMDGSFLDEMREISRKFFDLPMEDKAKYAKAVDGFEGYGQDEIRFENHPLDWVDRLYLLVTPKDQQKLQYWPENPLSFRNLLQEYTDRIVKIQHQLLKCIAKSISLPEDSFLNQFGEQSIIFARFNYYPRCSRPDLVNGLKPHADGSGITFLLQDKEVEGLQLKKDDQWFQVPIMSQALLVNLGDQLEIMSNGVFKSPVHRAVTNRERERMSLAMFCAPDITNEIGPVEELVDEKRPRLFKKITNYPQFYSEYFREGKRAIDAVRL